MKSNIEKLQSWLDQEKSKGLVDFKITTKSQLDSFCDGKIRFINREKLAGEILEMIHAPALPDRELL